jgi:hypothetical protein
VAADEGTAAQALLERDIAQYVFKGLVREAGKGARGSHG